MKYAKITDALDPLLIGLEVEVIREVTEEERQYMFSREERDKRYWWVSLFIPSLGDSRAIWKSEEYLEFEKGEPCKQ